MLWKDKVAYPGRLVTDIAVVAARCGVVLLLYASVFKIKGGSINGVTYEVAAWSMFLYFALMSMRLRALGAVIADDIKTGGVELFFTKPMSYLLYRSVWQFGTGLYPFVVTSIIGVTIMMLTVGSIDIMTNAYFYLSLISTLITCVILSLIIFAIVGLLAFWIEDNKPIFSIIDKAIMLLGGSYLPIALFPPLLYQVAVWSPFGASQFISHIVYDNWAHDYIKLLSLQIFWIVILGAIMLLMFKRAEKRLTVNGG